MKGIAVFALTCILMAVGQWFSSTYVLIALPLLAGWLSFGRKIWGFYLLSALVGSLAVFFLSGYESELERRISAILNLPAGVYAPVVLGVTVITQSLIAKAANALLYRRPK